MLICHAGSNKIIGDGVGGGGGGGALPYTWGKRPMEAGQKAQSDGLSQTYEALSTLYKTRRTGHCMLDHRLIAPHHFRRFSPDQPPYKEMI